MNRRWMIRAAPLTGLTGPGMAEISRELAHAWNENSAPYARHWFRRTAAREARFHMQMLPVEMYVVDTRRDR